jgi:hypothetical protein
VGDRRRGRGRRPRPDRLSLHRDAGATRFERELVYEMPNAWLAVLDRLFIRRRMAAESAAALRCLRNILEGAEALASR